MGDVIEDERSLLVATPKLFRAGENAHVVPLLAQRRFSTKTASGFEYQHLLLDIQEVTIVGLHFTMELELAAFVDTGTVWNEPNEFGMRRTRTGFGFGVRPIVPGVGEVRLDLGFGTDGGVVFHLGVMPKTEAQRARLR